MGATACSAQHVDDDDDVVVALLASQDPPVLPASLVPSLFLEVTK